jgi:hypothetical protein
MLIAMGDESKDMEYASCKRSTTRIEDPTAKKSSRPREMGLQALKLGNLAHQVTTDHFNALLDDPESDLVDSSLLIKSGLSSKQADKILNKNNAYFKLYFDYESKKIIAYEFNGNLIHEAILAEFTRQLGNFAHADGNRLITTHGVTNYGGRRMNADQCLILKPNSSSPPDPSHADLHKLVLQVGYSESVASLHGHAAYLFANSTGVQVYMFCKIWKIRRNHTRAACIAVYRRGQDIPVQFMSIGDAAPTPHFEEFYRNRFPNVQLPGIQNLNIAPGNNNAHIYSFTIPGSWILPDAAPALADLNIDCSRMVSEIQYF